MTGRILILDVDCTGLEVLVQLNGVTVLRDVAPERTSRSIQLAAWAVDGVNSLTLAAQRPTNWKDRSARVSLRLRDTQRNAPDAADRILVDYQWDAARQPLLPGHAVTLLTQTFSFAPAARWSWTHADVVPQLSPADNNAITSLMGALEQALTNRDITQVVQLQTIQLREQALAASGAPGGVEQRYAAFLSKRMTSASWIVQPLPWNVLQLRPMAGGRVHHLAGPGGTPALVVNSDDGVFAIDPYLSRLQGRWSIVR